jgi:hypothetical protein
MPFVYDTVIAATESLTTAGVMYTTSGTPGNLVDHLRFATGNAKAWINACYVLGRAAALTAISGISLRFVRLGTASTVGTAASIRPRDPNAPAAVLTAFSGPTIGSGTVSLQVAFGCGAGGPGGWVAPDPDSRIALLNGAGANGNLDMISGSQTASLNFDATVESIE